MMPMMQRSEHSPNDTSYLCLEHIPLELDDDNLLHLKMELFLDCTCLLKTCKLLPHTPMGETLLLLECPHISMNLLVEDLQIAPP